MEDDELIEILANYEHERWSRWQKYLFGKCKFNSDGTVIIPKEFVDRWTREMNTNYDSLTDEEKCSDRKEAIRIIKCLKDRERI